MAESGMQRAGEHDEKSADCGEDRATTKKVYDKVTSNRGSWPGDKRQTMQRRIALRRNKGNLYLTQRLHWCALLQKLQTGGDDFVARLEAARTG